MRFSVLKSLNIAKADGYKVTTLLRGLQDNATTLKSNIVASYKTEHVAFYQSIPASLEYQPSKKYNLGLHKYFYKKYS